MNPQQGPTKSGTIRQGINTCLIAAGATYLYRVGPEYKWVINGLWLLSAVSAYKFVMMGNTLMLNAIDHYNAMKVTGRGGTAGWATIRDLKAWKLLSKKNDFLLGLYENTKAVFVNIESCGMVLSPAGGGKTSCFVLPGLCHNALSMLVPDLKCTLAMMTAKYRAKYFKHIIICLNPAGLFLDILGAFTGKYNPLIILIDDWKDPKLHCFLFTDAQGLAKQICQDPPQEGENQYFRNGARKFLVFAFVYLVITRENPTLSDVLNLLSDYEALIAALHVARASDELNGDLARLAKDFLTKIEEGDKKQIESFREGAIQPLEIYSPSGSLADCTSTCTFRFFDLKLMRMTIYLMADPTRQSVYAPWIALLSWCCITELIRCQKNTSVCLLLDEICNFKLQGLPALMTIAREFKIIIWLILQELEQWAAVYGRESLDTLLSQTECKIFMGVRSLKTCQLISDMLGEETIKTSSYNLGRDVFSPIQHSVQEGPRRLLTADEVRRTDDIIVFIKSMLPLALNKIGYHETSPWSRRVGINPLFGKKHKGRTRLRM